MNNLTKAKTFDEWVHNGKGEDLWDAICMRAGFDDDGLELQRLIKHFVEEARKWK